MKYNILEEEERERLQFIIIDFTSHCICFSLLSHIKFYDNE